MLWIKESYGRKKQNLLEPGPQGTPGGEAYQLARENLLNFPKTKSDPKNVIRS